MAFHSDKNNLRRSLHSIRFDISGSVNSQSISNDIVAIYDKTMLRGVHRPTNSARISVISAPGPDIVNDYIARVDLERCLCFSSDISPNPEENVLYHRRIRG